MTVAPEIKALACELGVPQGLLAKRACMSRASLSLNLNGTLPEVERLAAALGTTPQDLIARAEWSTALTAPDDSSVGFTVQDKVSGSIILQVRRVDWDGGDAA